jgi:hypothetical protein
MNGSHVIERIEFAERWLDRARRQCEGGDVPQGLLTLFLANAEMTHTLRIAHEAAPSRRRWFVRGFAVAAACSLALVALGTWQVRFPTPVSSAEAPVIVTFNHRTGALLDLVETSPSQMSIVVEEKDVTPEIRHARLRTAVRPPLGRKRSVRAIASRPAVHAQAVRKSEIAPPPAQIVSRAVAPSVPSEQTAAAPIPSDAELINLVLTAERTLRTQSRP